MSAKKSVPTWFMVVGVFIVSAGAAVVAAAVVIGVMFAFVGFPNDTKKNPAPSLVQAKPEDDRVKDKEKPKELDEEIIEKPAPPLVAQPAKSDGPPVLILELPRPAGRSVLSADGSHVAYTIAKIGWFGYREGPAFDLPKETNFDGTTTSIHPLASSADGQLMAMTAGSRDGPQVFVWNWITMRVEVKFAISGLAASSAFSPDGKFLATAVPQAGKGGAPLRYWLHFHELKTRTMPSQWILDGEPNYFAFTADSNTILFAAKNEFTLRTWKRSTARPIALTFPQPSARHFFARDSARVAFVEGADQLNVLNMNGLNSLGKIETAKDTTLIHAAAFSADNRHVLLGVQDVIKGQRPIPVWQGGTGHGRLVEVETGKTIATTETLDAVPDRVELASNGIGLLQSQRLRPRLYRFPALGGGGGGGAVVKVPTPLPATDGFVPLFNGKDLTGWKTHEKQPGNWRVQDGILTGAGRSPSTLYTLRNDYKDFHLIVEARINDGGVGAVFARSGFGPVNPSNVVPRMPLGFRATINNTATGLKTGKLYMVREMSAGGKGIEMPARSGEWSKLELIADNNRLRLLVDDRETMVYNDVKSVYPTGHIALHVDYAKSILEIRRIEIKEK
jgi:3-keto-disaccharide hydrolase